MRLSAFVRYLMLFVVVVVLSIFQLPRGQAAALPVTSLADSGAGSLRDVVMSAPGGSSIYFNVRGTITLTSPITINQNLTIDSYHIITISGNNSTRIFTINTGVTVELRDIVLVNGTSTHGGSISNNGTLTINNATFSGHTATANGGSIYNTGILTINYVTFDHNTANNGGAIYNTGGLTINNSTFDHNTAVASGGQISNIGGTATIANVTFSSTNPATDGINNTDSASLTVSRSIHANGNCVNTSSTITDGGNNIAFNAAGCPGTNANPLLGTFGSYGSETQTIPLLPGSPALDKYSTGCPATDQRAAVRPFGISCDIGAYEGVYSVHTVTNLGNSGAGSLRDTIAAAAPGDRVIFSISGTISLGSQIEITRHITIDASNQTIILNGNNTVGVFGTFPNTTVELRNLSLINGRGAGSGALINRGTLTIYNLSIANSHAVTAGGAIYNNGTLFANDSTFSGNSAENNGGAIYNAGYLTVSNSTFVNNTSANLGGAIDDGSIPAVIQINNNTFYNNSAPTGSTYRHTVSLTTMSNNIFSGGSCSGTITDGGNNIAFNAAGCPGTNVDPLLGTLGNYGGSTQTIPLLTGSPAIDAYSTNCPATDQRGVLRPQETACDIGAFELASIDPTPTPSATSISENDFFAALETARAGYPDVQRIIPDFQTGTINLTVITADGTSGVVIVMVTQGQGFTELSFSSITVSGAPAPASYLTIVNRDLPQILTAALDALVTERFGSLVNVYSITVTNSTMQVSLNAP